MLLAEVRHPRIRADGDRARCLQPLHIARIDKRDELFQSLHLGGRHPVHKGQKDPGAVSRSKRGQRVRGSGIRDIHSGIRVRLLHEPGAYMAERFREVDRSRSVRGLPVPASGLDVRFREDHRREGICQLRLAEDGDAADLADDDKREPLPRMHIHEASDDLSLGDIDRGQRILRR